MISAKIDFKLDGQVPPHSTLIVPSGDFHSLTAISFIDVLLLNVETSLKYVTITFTLRYFYAVSVI